jgi:hypothetical protein
MGMIFQMHPSAALLLGKRFFSPLNRRLGGSHGWSRQSGDEVKSLIPTEKRKPIYSGM